MNSKRLNWRKYWPQAVLIILAVFWLGYQALVPSIKAANATFLVAPYLQLGPAGDVHTPHVLFATGPETAHWQVEVAPEPEKWLEATALSDQHVNLADMPPFRLFRAALPTLPEGRPIAYRVLKNGVPVFRADIKSIKPAADQFRVDLAGDVGYGSEAERVIAGEIFDSKPDLVVIPGDVTYGFGRTLEYLARFFPYYNADPLSKVGYPLLRSTLSVAAPGNHDTAIGAGDDTRDLDTFPDGLGYFLWWDQPLNGPKLPLPNADKPVPRGSSSNLQAFLSAAGGEYPLEENFSFDYANVHWTIIDANDYMDWTHQNLRQWLIHDLDQANKSPFKFVIFHQPPFSSDPHHFADQQMRLVADILQDHGVDIAFAGHVHGFQRTYPLKFNLNPQSDGSLRSPQGFVNGRFQIDKDFDGVKNTHPRGVIYIVTAGGGADLRGQEESKHPGTWQPFTAKYLSRHSFTQCDIKGRRVHIKQIGDHADVLDEFTIDKTAAS